MNMPPHAERGAATKSRLLCRNLSRLMKSMRTALGAPARCTARCGVSPTSTIDHAAQQILLRIFLAQICRPA